MRTASVIVADFAILCICGSRPRSWCRRCELDSVLSAGSIHQRNQLAVDGSLGKGRKRTDERGAQVQGEEATKDGESDFVGDFVRKSNRTESLILRD